MSVVNMDCLAGLRMLADSSVDLVVTDPPYLIKNTLAGNRRDGGLGGRIQKNMDDLDDARITAGYRLEVLSELVRVCKGINIYLFCNKAQIPEYIDFFVNKHKTSFDLLKWVKTDPTPNFYNKYMTDTEYVFYARKGGLCMPSCYEDAGTLYQSRTNKADRKLYGHPTPKPVEFLRRLVRNSSEEGGLVLDPFAGSGSTGEAAVAEGRNFIGFELSKKYADTANKRIEHAKSIRNDL